MKSTCINEWNHLKHLGMKFKFGLYCKSLIKTNKLKELMIIVKEHYFYKFCLENDKNYIESGMPQ
jgi:hypothetical protein